MSLFEVVTNWVEGHTRGRDEDRYGFDNHEDAKAYANERLGDADTAKVVIRNTETGEENEWKGDAPTEVPPPDPTQSGGSATPPSDTSVASGDDSQATADQLNAQEAASNPTGDNPPAPPEPMPGDANPPTNT